MDCFPDQRGLLRLATITSRPNFDTHQVPSMGPICRLGAAILVWRRPTLPLTWRRPFHLAVNGVSVEMSTEPSGSRF